MAHPTPELRTPVSSSDGACNLHGAASSGRPPGLTTRVLQGGMLLGGQRILSVCLAGLGSILLARLLTPEIFGAYAILWFLVALAINVADMGMTAALIQRDEAACQRSLSVIAVVQFMLTFALALSLAVGAPGLAQALGLGTEVIWPLRFLTLLLPLSALRLPPALLLERRLCYLPLMMADSIDTMVFYGVAVLAASQHAGLWSFVIGALVGRVVSVAALWVRSPWHPTFPLQWSEWPRTVALGWAFQSTALLVQGREAVTPLLVRYLSGVPAVGLLNLASTLALQTVQITNMASRVLFPAFSQLQRNAPAFAAACERALNRIAIVVFPATCFLGTTADPVVRLVYGSQWVGAIPALQLLCVSALMTGLSMVAIHALNGLGHAHVVFRLNVIWTLILWCLTPLLVVPFGFVGYAMAHALQGLTSVLVFVRLQGLISIRIGPQLRSPCLAAAITGTALLVLAPWISDLVRLGIALGAALMTYVCLLTVLSGRAWRAQVSREWRQLVGNRWSPGLP